MKLKDMICGKCVYHRKHPNGDWHCNNEDSENYVMETEYGDTCDDGFEER